MFMAALAVTLADSGRLAEAKLVHTELVVRSAREYVAPFHCAANRVAEDRHIDRTQATGQQGPRLRGFSSMLR
jgi:hypothetical protein